MYMTTNINFAQKNCSLHHQCKHTYPVSSNVHTTCDNSGFNKCIHTRLKQLQQMKHTQTSHVPSCKILQQKAASVVMNDN